MCSSDLYRKGELLEQRGDHEKALEQYKQCLSQVDKPIPVMEKIVMLLEKMGRFDQLGGFLNQLLSLDPMNKIGLGLSEQLKKGQAHQVTSTLDVERLEKRIEELLESKLSALVDGSNLAQLPPQARPVSRNTPVKTKREASEEMEDPFSNDRSHLLEDIGHPPFEAPQEEKLRGEFYQPVVSEASEAKETVYSHNLEEKANQSDSLIFLKEAQRKLSSPEDFSSSELSAIKAEALKRAQSIKDPILGFFWTGEISKF